VIEILAGCSPRLAWNGPLWHSSDGLNCYTVVTNLDRLPRLSHEMALLWIGCHHWFYQGKGGACRRECYWREPDGVSAQTSQEEATATFSL
jgi:hypothetical protein